jgi:hypothetical protein
VARPLIVIAAFLCLAVPAALAAPPANKGKNRPEQSATTQAAPDNAAAKCKAERTANADAFKTRYGSNGLGACVAGLQAKKNPAKTCKAERGTTPASLAAFKARHGTNDNNANALGKCVSKLAKAQND